MLRRPLLQQTSRALRPATSATRSQRWASTTPSVSPDISVTTDLVTHAMGDLKAMGLASSWTPVGWFQQALETIHITTGLPWWATIVAGTLAANVALTPLLIKYQQQAVNLKVIQPELAPAQAEVEKATAAQDSAALVTAKNHVAQVYHKYKMVPLPGLLLPAISVPVFFSILHAVKDMADAGVPGFKDGGFLWFSDLTVADPYYVLPVLFTAQLMAAVPVFCIPGTKPKTIRNLRIGALMLSPFLAFESSAYFVNWITTMAYTTAQAVVLQQTIRAAPELQKLAAKNVDDTELMK
ncbi:60Kd inner membrane protein-domain-containing protein [Blastocladiella britannica]|nr:60Kd inner membrane protein-domain-containing protein [Blastocladiella britannica]